MHFGHARTALLTWLRARSAGGRIVMRIEDLDPPRVRPGSAERIQEDHAWLGLDWDEGPFFQSARGDAYEAALSVLRESGQVYPCYCTRREIQEAVGNAPHGERDVVYPGTCRPPRLSPAPKSRPPAQRFLLGDKSPGFCDLLAGVVAPGAVRGDFVVRRSDGLWAYQLAVVVDDAAMGITEVVRGDDLLLSTPRQLALYASLGLKAPRFVHIGLVLGTDGEKLSKRHGSPPIRARRDVGASREQLLGELAFSLGLRALPKPVSRAELLDSFSLDQVHAGAVRIP